MTVIYFDAETREAFRKIAELVDIMGIEFEQELSDTEAVHMLSDTEIKDKDGVVHDLAELVKSGCVIDTGVALHMAVHDYYTCINGWTSSGGFSHSSERLAKLIREHADDPDVEITVYKF